MSITIAAGIAFWVSLIAIAQMIFSTSIIKRKVNEIKSELNDDSRDFAVIFVIFKYFEFFYFFLYLFQILFEWRDSKSRDPNRPYFDKIWIKYWKFFDKILGVLIFIYLFI